MKKNWFCLFVWMAAFFLMSCAEDSVLILDGEVGDERFRQGESGEGGDADGKDSTDEEVTGLTVMIHICGCVVSPGVYEVPEGSRVYEAIELAGGFSAGAAESYLNLAEIVSDGQKLVVPSLAEVESDRYGQIGEEMDNGLVNINTADKERLMTLPGIGEARAEAIIAWRKENGNFQTKEEIMQVSGIKEAAYEKIKLLITVE